MLHSRSASFDFLVHSCPNGTQGNKGLMSCLNHSNCFRRFIREITIWHLFFIHCQSTSVHFATETVRLPGDKTTLASFVVRDPVFLVSN